MKPYYERDGITIYHGDALEVIPQLEDVGAIVTDPPYSSGGIFRSDRTQATLVKYVDSRSAGQDLLQEFGGDHRDQRSFLTWSTLWLVGCFNACRPGAPVLVFSDWRQLPTMSDAVQAGGFVWRNVATWWKPGIRMQRARFSSSSEFIVYGTKGVPVDHDGAPQNVKQCAPVGLKTKHHIAEKPLEVVLWILGVVPPGWLVCDPFMGSGTTLVAAKRSGFPAVGVESSEAQCEAAVKRLSQNALFAG